MPLKAFRLHCHKNGKMQFPVLKALNCKCTIEITISHGCYKGLQYFLYLDEKQDFIHIGIVVVDGFMQQ